MNIGSEGQIVIVKNIIFKDYNNEGFRLNRDAHLERPCLVISEIDDKRYMLPISSSINNKYYKTENIQISNYDLLYRTLRYNRCYIKLDKIIKRDICYKEPVDYLDKIKYYKCLLKLIMYYERLEFEVEEYEMIKDNLKEQIEKIKAKEKLSI